MRKLHEIQNQVDADIESVELIIRDCLKQAEQIYSDRAKPVSNLKLQIANSCVASLQKFRKTRTLLMARRQLFEAISLN